MIQELEFKIVVESRGLTKIPDWANAQEVGLEVTSLFLVERERERKEKNLIHIHCNLYLQLRDIYIQG